MLKQQPSLLIKYSPSIKKIKPTTSSFKSLASSKSSTYQVHFVLFHPKNVHRLYMKHVEDVEKLVSPETEPLFGYVSPKINITDRYVSFGLYKDHQLIAAVSFDDHPNVPAVPAWEWYHWLHNLYHIDDFTTANTLFIHFAVWNHSYTLFFLKPILQRIFDIYETLETIVFTCPPGFQKVDFIEHLAKRHLPFGFVNPAKVPTLYILERSHFVPQYIIRRAVEEDNDDLVAIIPKNLEELYGPYYISELIRFPEAGRQVIVAEYKGTAVAMLCLNNDVNYKLLNEEFELVPFNGLKKPNIADEIKLSISGTGFLLVAEEQDNVSLTCEVAPSEDKDKGDGDAIGENASDDEFSLVNLSSSIFLNFLYEEDEQLSGSESGASIESRLSAVVLNEEYEDHLYNADFRESTAFMEPTYERRQTRQTRSYLDQDEVPTFHGHPNAFSMEICAAIPEHESSLYLLFQAAFECFPEKDYSVVSFPCDAPYCYIVKHFCRIAPRKHSLLFPHELYALHRNSVLGKVSVRIAVPEDKDDVQYLLSSLTRPWSVEEAFRDAVDNLENKNKAYVFLSEWEIVGFAVLSEETEQEYLEVHYAVDSWINTDYNRFGNYGAVEYFFVSPIFQRHQPYFLRELHRLSQFRVLFCHLRRYEYMFSHKAPPINNAINSMSPVVPNQIIEYVKEVHEEYCVPQAVANHQPFALYVSSTRLTSLPRIEVNQKLVVVGAGDTAIAFLESLIYTRNFRAQVIFTNVTIVSPHGISFHRQPNKIREMIFVSNGHLDRRHMEIMCLKTYVHVVTGVMSAIDRKAKVISLMDETYISYDYMFLLCGEQFQKPPKKKKEIVKRRTEFPANVFIINTEADASNSITTLKSLLLNQKNVTIVVYGHYLEAICTIAAIIEFGVKASNIVYVDPSPDTDNPLSGRHEHLTNFFNNKDIETTVFEEMLKLGVTIYQDYNFVEWHQDFHSNLVTSARFESKYKFIELEVTALFLYCAKSVSARTYQAIHRSGLIFNGKLVIDMDNKTNDPFIYAAGSLTMYSAKYGAEHLMHRYFNGEEIGYNLGQQIRRQLIPAQFLDDPPEVKPLNLKPLVQYCRFPGNLNYLKVYKPGKPTPLDVCMNKAPYGKVLVTGDCRKLDKQGYFRLHLNQYNTVETITCLAKEELNVHNLIALYGKHESLLNNLVLRYDMNMVPDLFVYFKQPWMCAVYHPKFPQLMQLFNGIISTLTTADETTIIDEIRKKLEDNKWNQLTKMQNDEIEELCRDTSFFQTIEKLLIEFLYKHKMYLPMYAHHMIITWVKHEVQSSSMFVPKVTKDLDYGRKYRKFMPF